MMNRTYMSALLLVVSAAAFAGDIVPAVDANQPADTVIETPTTPQAEDKKDAQPSYLNRVVGTLQRGGNATVKAVCTAGGKVAEYKKTSATVGGLATAGSIYAARNTRPVNFAKTHTASAATRVVSATNAVVATRPVQASWNGIKSGFNAVTSTASSALSSRFVQTGKTRTANACNFVATHTAQLSKTACTKTGNGVKAVCQLTRTYKKTSAGIAVALAVAATEARLFAKGGKDNTFTVQGYKAAVSGLSKAWNYVRGNKNVEPVVLAEKATTNNEQAEKSTVSENQFCATLLNTEEDGTEVFLVLNKATKDVYFMARTAEKQTLFDVPHKLSSENFYVTDMFAYLLAGDHDTSIRLTIHDAKSRTVVKTVEGINGLTDKEFILVGPKLSQPTE